MKRVPWLQSLVIATLAVAVVSCQKQQPAVADAPQPLATQVPVAAPPPPAAEAEPSNPCNTGPVNNPNQPILCVDDTAFPAITIAPDPATAVHVNPARTVHWFTKSGSGTIGIVYDSSLLDPPGMNPGKGHTKAKAGSQGGSVKYTVVVVRGTATSSVIDPTIIIDTNGP